MLLALTALLARAADDGAALLAAYDAVRVPLVDDRLADAKSAAGTLPGLPADVATAASGLTLAADPTEARHAFGELSRVVILDLAATGAPPGTKVFHCPMTSEWPYWLQPTAGIANPYMGHAMPTWAKGPP